MKMCGVGNKGAVLWVVNCTKDVGQSVTVF